MYIIDLFLTFSGPKITYNKTEFLYITKLEFFNITKEQNNTEYLCYENNKTETPLGRQISVEGRLKQTSNAQTLLHLPPHQLSYFA
jgi:hypothetical protein